MTYRLGEKIGAGGFGSIYEAVHTQTNEHVVIKVLRKWEEVEREGNVMKSCGYHRNIVMLKDMMKHECGHGLLILEKMDMDLNDYISSVLDVPSIIQEKDIRFIMREILEGLKYLHEDVGLMHLDIKPGNVLINVSEKMEILDVKLCDFGLARYLTQPRLRGGTPDFHAPPELLFGAKEYGTEVDIWAAGCVFMILLLGGDYHPFEPELDHYSDNASIEYKKEVMRLITRWIGPPNYWPEMPTLPKYHQFKDCFQEAGIFGECFKSITRDKNAEDLLSRMLCFNPLNRISAKEALESKYFQEGNLKNKGRKRSAIKKLLKTCITGIPQI